MPLHAPQRSYHYRVVSFILLCLCGFLFGGACVLLAFLLFEPSDTNLRSKGQFLSVGTGLAPVRGVWKVPNFPVRSRCATSFWTGASPVPTESLF